MPKKVLIAGFTGAMGQKAVSLVNQLSNFELVAGFAPKAVNEPERYHLPKTAQIFNQLSQIPAHAADIWIDFTTPAAVYDNVYFALTHQIKPIVGTTGLSDDQEATLIELAKKEKLGGLRSEERRVGKECGSGGGARRESATQRSESEQRVLAVTTM